MERENPKRQKKNAPKSTKKDGGPKPPSKKRSLENPEDLPPIPAAAPSEEPQVDEVEDTGDRKT